MLKHVVEVFKIEEREREPFRSSLSHALVAPSGLGWDQGKGGKDKRTLRGWDRQANGGSPVSTHVVPWRVTYFSTFTRFTKTIFF